jgi:hypothetical protein
MTAIFAVWPSLAIYLYPESSPSRVPQYIGPMWSIPQTWRTQFSFLRTLFLAAREKLAWPIIRCQSAQSAHPPSRGLKRKGRPRRVPTICMIKTDNPCIVSSLQQSPSQTNYFATRRAHHRHRPCGRRRDRNHYRPSSLSSPCDRLLWSCTPLYRAVLTVRQSIPLLSVLQVSLYHPSLKEAPLTKSRTAPPYPIPLHHTRDLIRDGLCVATTAVQLAIDGWLT